MKKMLYPPIFVMLFIVILFCFSIPSFCGNRLRIPGIIIFCLLIPYLVLKIILLFKDTLNVLKIDKNCLSIRENIYISLLYKERISLLVSIIFNLIIFFINMIYFIFDHTNIYIFLLFMYYAIVILLKGYLIKNISNYTQDENNIVLCQKMRLMAIISLILSIIYFFLVGIFSITDKSGSVSIMLLIVLSIYSIYTIIRLIRIFRKRKTNFKVISHSMALLDLFCLLITIMNVFDLILRLCGFEINDDYYVFIFILLAYIGSIIILVECIKTIKLCNNQIKNI